MLDLVTNGIEKKENSIKDANGSMTNNYVINMEGKKQAIISAFVAIYGEENKDKISYAISNSHIIISNPDDKENYSSEMKSLYDDYTHTQDKESLNAIIAENNVYLRYFIDKGIELSPYSKDELNREFVNDFLLNKHHGHGVHFILYDINNKPINLVIGYNSKKITNRTIIHELGHAVSSSQMIKGANITEKIGICKKIINLDTFDHDIINYEQVNSLNEIINEYVILKVKDILDKKGVSIIEREDNELSYYQKALIVFTPLFEKYFDIFKEIYISNDFNALENAFDREIIQRIDTLANNTFKAIKASKSLEDFEKNHSYSLKNEMGKLLQIIDKKKNIDTKESSLNKSNAFEQVPEFVETANNFTEYEEESLEYVEEMRGNASELASLFEL